jgi:hypothetical protein
MGIPLSKKQFQQMRKTHTDLMHDACKLVTSTPGATVHNVPRRIYTVATKETPCGFDPTGGQLQLGGTRVIMYQGTIRLPHGTPIDNLGGFRLTTQAWEPLTTPRSYILAAPPEFGPTAITCRVNVVTDSAF